MIIDCSLHQTQGIKDDFKGVRFLFNYKGGNF
jgi:hypothetical protein